MDLLESSEERRLAMEAHIQASTISKKQQQKQVPPQASRTSFRKEATPSFRGSLEHVEPETPRPAPNAEATSPR